MPIILEQSEKSESQKIKEMNTYLLNEMKSVAKAGFILFWNNPSKTPQEICDEFGTDAVKCFELHGQLQQLIYAIDNTWQPLVPPFERVNNEDGTVTIIYP